MAAPDTPTAAQAAVRCRPPRRARWSVAVYFFILGCAGAVWTARIPTIKGRLGLSDGSLSLGLLAMTGTSVVAVVVAGRLVDRLGTQRMLVAAAVLLGAALVGPGVADDLAGLMVALGCFGAALGTTDVAMNVRGVEVERAYGRPVMASFHAQYSLGGLLGALAGALAAHLGASPLLTFAVAGSVFAVLAVAVSAWLSEGSAPRRRASAVGRAARGDGDRGAVDGGDPADADRVGALGQPAGQAEDTPVPGTRRPSAGRRRDGAVRTVLALLVVMCVCSFLGEGAMADWGSVYLHDALGASTGVAPVGFAAFSVAMTAGRLVGDRLALAVGPVRLIRGFGLVAAVGLGLGLVSGNVAATIAAFGAFGLGVSAIAPQAFSAAGNLEPDRAGHNLAVVSGVGYLGMVTGPVVIGWVAEATSLRVGLAIPALLAVGVAATAGAVRPRS